jgi:hypothetical protein
MCCVVGLEGELRVADFNMCCVVSLQSQLTKAS